MASNMAAEYADRGYVFRESLLSPAEITSLSVSLPVSSVGGATAVIRKVGSPISAMCTPRSWRCTWF